MRVGDLVGINPIKTVIHLKDSDQAPDELVSSFVITDEVEFGLKILLSRMARGAGAGLFVKGHYGTGKSHFLAYLTLLFRGYSEASSLLQTAPELVPLWQELPRVGVASVSLLDYQATFSLEEIVCAGLAKEYEVIYPGPNRREFFSSIKAAQEKRGQEGLVIILDELSEFLRATPSGPPFNEDLRFLQFLGEEASSFPLWVLASLQEDIEHTGHIATAVFLKIKDRYPLRVTFDMPHVRELVATRLVYKKSGAEEGLRSVWEELSGAFPGIGFTYDEFLPLYPLHPATIDLFEELKFLLSQKRGVVEFIYYRLKGDPDRNISSFLDMEAARLLTPDFVFDHFRSRLAELPEAAAYVDRVWTYFKKEIPRLFDDEGDREVALRAVKILILKALSSGGGQRSVRELAEALLIPHSRLDPELNYLYLKDILDTIWKKGAFVVRTEEGDDLEVSYSISLKEDLSLLLARRLKALRKDVKDPADTLFRGALTLVAQPHLPLASLGLEEKWAITWQNTSREGRVKLGLLSEIDPEKMEEAARVFGQTEADWFLFVGHPYHVQDQRSRLMDTLLPAARTRDLKTVLFWLPKEVPLNERLLEMATRLELKRRLADDPDSKKIAKLLDELIVDDLPLLREWINESYFSGEVVSAFGEEAVDLSRFGLIPFENLLTGILGAPLDRAFPRHAAVAPTARSVLTTAVEEVVEKFLRPGELSLEPGRGFNLRLVIEGYLKPLGLVHGSRRSYRLKLDPQKNQLLAHLLQEVGPEGINREALYWRLRKGPYGLDQTSNHILVLALVLSGVLIPFSRERRVPLSRIGYRRISGIEFLKRGRLIAHRLSERLAELDWLDKNFRRMDITLASQEKLWRHLIEEASRLRDTTDRLHAFLQRYHDFEVLKDLPLDRLPKDLEDAGRFLELIQVSKPAIEGLETFLEGVIHLPFWKDTRARMIRFLDFFQNEFDRYLFLRSYLEEAGKVLPPDTPHEHARELCEEAAGFARDPSTFFQPDFLSSLNHTFELFLAEYIVIYCEAHDEAFGLEIYEDMAALRQTPLYRRLKQLEELHLGGGSQAIHQVENDLDEAARNRCRRPVAEILRQRPFCACGFRPGGKMDLPSVDVLESRLTDALADFENFIASAKVRELIETHGRMLRELGRPKEASRLLGFLEAMDSGDFELQSLPQKTLALVGEALSSRSALSQRELSDLAKALKGRIMTRHGIMKTVEEWLKEEYGDREIYYTIREGQDTAPRVQEAQAPYGGYQEFMEEILLSSMKSGMCPAVPRDTKRWDTGTAGDPGAGLAALISARRAMGGLEAAMKEPGEPRSPREWEKLYVEFEAPLAYFLESCMTYVSERDPAWSREFHDGAHGLLEQARECFFRDYFRLLEGKTEGRMELWGTWEILGPLSEMLSKKFSESSLRPILIDGLRMDLWLAVREGMDRVEVLREGVLWALSPTVTSRQLTAMAQGSPGPLRQEVLFQIDQAEAGRLSLDKIDLVDETIHVSRLPLTKLFAELVPKLREALRGRLERLDEGELLLIFGDHGFRENPAYEPRDKYEEPRYAHGGISPEEVLVPWALLGRGV